MELFDKPPFKKPSTWVKAGCFTLVFLLISLGFLTYSIKETVRYFAMKNEAISLVAVGSSVIKEEDSDGDEYYRLIVEFFYAGEKYHSSYGRYRSRDSAEAMIGKEVAITINPSNPKEQLRDIAFGASIYLLLSSLMLIGVFAFVFIPKRKWYVEAYGLHRACIEKDVWRKHWQNMSPWLGFYAVVLVVVIIFLMFRGDAGNIPSLSLLCLGLGTVSFIPWLKDTKLIRRGKFRHSVHTLVNKETQESDNGTDYYLVYSDGNLTWSHKVSRRKYKEAQMGETVIAVFLEGRKKAHLVYDDLKNPVR